MTSSATNVESIAKDIREYFSGNPEAGDTVEGITDWWVSRERLKDASNMVRQALDYLVDQGELRKRVYGGREIYVRQITH